MTSSLSTSSAPGAAAAAAWAARPTRWAKYLTCGVVELMNTFPRHLPLGVCRHVLDFLAYDVATLVDLAAVNIAFRRLCREGRLWEKLDLSNRPLTDGFLWRLLRVAPLQHARGLNLSSLSRPSARLLAGCTKHTSPRLLRRSQESARDLTLEPLAEEAEKLFPTLGVGFSAQDRDAGAAPGAASAPQPDKLRLRLGMGLRLREIDVSNNRVITAEVLCAILSRTRGLANLVMTSADQVVNDEKLPLLTRAMTASGTRLRVLRMGTRTSRTQMQLKNLTRVSDDVCAQFLASVGAAAGMAMREHEGAEADGFFEMRSSGSPKRATRSSSEGLEVLSLYNQTLVSARTIHAITHTPTARTLRELDLSCCSRIADEMIEVVSRALPVLASLDVSNCWKITDAGLRCLRMAPHLSRTLHTLRLSGLNFITGSELSRVARQLHTLAHLTAARVPNVDDETLRELASSLGEAAKSFDFSHCDKITREGASALCLQCPNLESLVLAKCAQLNAEFLQDVAQICDGDAASSGAHEASASGLRRLLRRKDPLASLNHLNLREVRGFDDACLRAILLAKELAIKAGNEDVARLQKLLVGGTTYKSANWDAAEDESDVDLAASAAVGLSDAGMEFLASEPLLADALEVLDLEGHTGVSDRGVLLLVRRADRMRLLRLNGLRSLTNASIEAMLVPAVMPALAELHVAWCAGLTASVVESLKKSRPHLQLSLMKGRKLLPHHQ
uniref:F-box domain-containing protein n=1 Tax=Phaeomonas parva TaxID=124430 RepID=A0A7S1XWB3_9STRA